MLGDLALGPQCETHCKYKYDKSSADIRIGDLWGKTYQQDQKGTSALIAFTEKGLKIVENLHDVSLVEHPFEVVAEGQMKRNAKAKIMKPIIMCILRNGGSLTGLPFRIAYNIQRCINVCAIKIKRIIR